MEPGMQTPRHEIDAQASEPYRFGVLIGRSLELSLHDYYSSGYRWDFVADEAVLAVRKLPKEDDGDAHGIGSCAPVVLSVEARAPGKHRLDLELRRPWEAGPARRVQVEVTGHRPTIFD